jgi:hypothetical protein
VTALSLSVTLWRTYSSGRREAHTWPSLLDRLGVRDPEVVTTKRAVAGFSLGAFKDNRRALSRVEHVDALVLDLDHGLPTVDAIVRALPRTGGVVYTTWSHEPHAPRFRAILPYSRPVPADEHARIWLAAQHRCDKARLELDPRARDASHLFFLPSHRPEGQYGYVELPGEPIDVDGLLREAEEIPHTRVVPCSGTSGNNTRGVASLDCSPSGVDFRFCLDRIRAGDSDAEIAEVLRRRSSKARLREDYVERTLANARAVHEARAPIMRVRRATLCRLPARFGYAERTHVELTLESADGELVTAKIVVPRDPDSPAATTWAACFPDIDPASLLVRWRDIEPVWRRIRLRHRVFDVAARDREVRWIRAAEAQSRALERERQVPHE